MRYRNEVLGDHSGSVRAEGWSYGIAEHLTKHDFSFASMHTAMENAIYRRDR